MLGRPQMTDAEPQSTLARLGLDDLRPVYQPVVDLRDGRVVGYEALVRGGPTSPHGSPAEMFALARAEDVVAEFDAACRAAAVRGFDHEGTSPFTLFLNAAADTLGDAAEIVAPARHTIVIEITEGALISRPDVLLRALTQFRGQGWGVALENVGADSRSLALMSLLYPDVIKLDLRRLQQRSPGGHRADRRRGRRRERAPAGRRPRRGHRLRGADGGRPRVRRPARAGLPARRAGAAPLPHARARPAAPADLLGRRSGRRQPVPARDQLEAPAPAARASWRSARPG